MMPEADRNKRRREGFNRGAEAGDRKSAITKDILPSTAATHAKPTFLISVRYARASSRFASFAHAFIKQEYVRASGGVAGLFFILSNNKTP